jgi:hypothetical protein
VKDTGQGSEWPRDVSFDPFATDLFALRQSWVTCSIYCSRIAISGLVLIIDVLGALIGLAALFGVLMYALR